VHQRNKQREQQQKKLLKSNEKEKKPYRMFGTQAVSSGKLTDMSAFIKKIRAVPNKLLIDAPQAL
jgi:hypothetical protein